MPYSTTKPTTGAPSWLTRARIVFEQSAIHSLLVRRRERRELRAWEAGGRSTPPPGTVKREILWDYAAEHNLRILVETGTYLGDTVAASLERFDRIYSIELSPDLYHRAVLRFRSQDHIKLFHGDSALVLPTILSEIDEPALFWLDGHYSGGVTAKGRRETPIEAEMTSILNHSVRNHVVLIDDARCFTGQKDYPSLSDLGSMVGQQRPGASFEVEHDIIRICL